MKNGLIIASEQPLAEWILELAQAHERQAFGLVDGGFIPQIELLRGAQREAVQAYFARQGWIPRHVETTDVGLFACEYADAHTDDVLGDTTVGLVIRGAHRLYTGRAHVAGDLTPGTVYALHNKRNHGARRMPDTNEILYFLAIDCNMAWEDYFYWRKKHGVHGTA